MKKKLITLAPYTIVLAADFYLLPLLAANTGTAMLIMLCVIPLTAFICSILYGIRHGFDLSLPILAAILFIPTIFLYYNESAWIYTCIYAVTVLAGNGIGRLFYKRR